MKKILLILTCIFITAYADSINPLLNEAIRISDLEKVKELLELKPFTFKEKKAYLELAEEILLMRIISPVSNVPSNLTEDSGLGKIWGGLFCIPIALSGIPLSFFHKGCILISPAALISSYLLLKKGGKLVTVYREKVSQLHKNAQEIKQLILIS